MRDQPGMPATRENESRGETTAGRGEDSSAAQADETSADLRTDTPAPLLAASHPADIEALGLTDEEIAIYRRRVADGMYDSREVADEVARRMLRRGDI